MLRLYYKDVDTMDKEQFISLDILEIIEYINKGLYTDSLTKVCKDIGVDRATIRKMFRSNGYTLVDNKYSYTDTTEDTATAYTIGIKNVVKKANTKVTKKTNNTEKKILSKRMDSLEQQLQRIINKLDIIIHLIQLTIS